MIKILVVGELCLDRFVYGKVNRLCPEAPVPVINPIETKENRGMAGNVVENLKALHNDVEVLHWHQKSTILKTRYVEKNSNQMVVRVDEGENDKVDRIEFNNKIDLKEYDFVIISDYDKGFLSDTDITKISRESNLTILDSKRFLSHDVIKYVDFVKLNHIEYINNKTIVDDNLNKVLITRGKDGVDYNHLNFKSPNPQDTIDVSGAGDTFVACFSLNYYITKDVIKSIEYANLVCSNVVNKKGVSLPDKTFKLG